MNLKELRSNWNGYAATDPLFGVLSNPDKRGGKWDVDDFFQTGKQEIDAVIKKASLLGVPIVYERALDFGCAVGRLTNALCEHFHRVDGVDISEKMIDLAKHYNRHGDQCSFHINTKDELELFDNEAFDFIYSNIVLQHMDPVYSRKYLVEFLRILRPEGMLVFQLPSDYIGVSNKKVIRRFAIKHHLKKITKTILPIQIVEWLKNREANKRPLMQMYGIPKEQILELLENAGGTLLHLSENKNAGGDWTSFTYLFLNVRRWLGISKYFLSYRPWTTSLLALSKSIGCFLARRDVRLKLGCFSVSVRTHIQ